MQSTCTKLAYLLLFIQYSYYKTEKYLLKTLFYVNEITTRFMPLGFVVSLLIVYFFLKTPNQKQNQKLNQNSKRQKTLLNITKENLRMFSNLTKFKLQHNKDKS